MRCGTESRRITLVAAIASGGETIAPSANAAAQGRLGTMEWATHAIVIVVKRTNPMASSKIGRKLRRKSRHDVKSAAG